LTRLLWRRPTHINIIIMYTYAYDFLNTLAIHYVLHYIIHNLITIYELVVRIYYYMQNHEHILLMVQWFSGSYTLPRDVLLVTTCITFIWWNYIYIYIIYTARYEHTTYMYMSCLYIGTYVRVYFPPKSSSGNVYQ